MIDRYYLFICTRRIVSVIWFNDAPILVDLAGEGAVTCEPVDPWIKPGSNTLCVDLSWPVGQVFRAGQAQLEVTFFIADPGAERPRPGRVLARFTWPLPDEEEESQYPHRHQQQVLTPSSPRVHLWNEAEHIDNLDPCDRQEIHRLATSLRDALMSHQPERVYSLFEYRYTDEALAEGKPVARIQAAAVNGYREMLAYGDLEFAPMGEDSVHLRVHDDGLVVHITREAFQPAILAHHHKTGASFGIPLFAARVGGVWRLVR